MQITVHLAQSANRRHGGSRKGTATVSLPAGTVRSLSHSAPAHATMTSDEDDGSVTVKLRTAEDGATIVGYTIGTPDSATVTIEDDDTVPGTPVVSALGLDTKLVLNWSKPAEGTSSINGYDYRYKTTAGGEETWSTWTDTGLSGSDATNDFEITGLTNGTDYTVEIQAKSDAGVSLAGSANAIPTPGPEVDSVAITSTPATANTYIIAEDIVVHGHVRQEHQRRSDGSFNSAPGYMVYNSDFDGGRDFGETTADVDCTVAGAADEGRSYAPTPSSKVTTKSATGYRRSDANAAISGQLTGIRSWVGL